jgi:hypothetical protein
MTNLTLAQIETITGAPIVLMQMYDLQLQQFVQFTTDNLPPTALTVLLAWINAHMGNVPPNI